MSTRAPCLAGAILAFVVSTMAGLLAPVFGDSVPSVFERVITFNRDDFSSTHYGRYDLIRMRGGYTDQAREHLHHPSLPVFVKWILLPPDRMIDRIDVVPVERVEIPGRYLPFPILDDRNDEEPPDTPPWQNIVYPRRTGFISMAGPLRAFRLAKICVYPLEYDAASQQLSLLRSVAVRLTTRPLTEEELSETKIERPEAADDPFGSNRQWIRSVVLNPEDLDRFYPRYRPEYGEGSSERKVGTPDAHTPYGSFISDRPSTEGGIVDYIVITSNQDLSGSDVGDMESVFSDWVANVRPLTGVVKTTDWIDENYPGFDRTDRIRNFISESVQLWGVSYVLLGGDVSVVPTRRLGGPDQDIWDRPDPAGDAWYTRATRSWQEFWNADSNAYIGETYDDLNLTEIGQDGFSPIVLTRLPARSAPEAAAMLNKIREYLFVERQPDDDFYQSALVAAGPTNGVDTTSNGIMTNGVRSAEYVVPETLGPHGWSTHRLYPDMGYGTVAGCPAVGDTCYYDLYHYIKRRVGSGYWVGDAFRDALDDPNTCPQLVYHVEHSLRDRLGHPSLNSSCRPPSNGCSEQWRSDCLNLMSTRLDLTTESIDINQVMALRNGQNESRYFFMFSNGSWTNMNDMDAISEAFLRAPNGGAVFYVGKGATYGGIKSDVYQNAVENAFATSGNPYGSFAACVRHGIYDVYNGETYGELDTEVTLNLLGEPLMWAYSAPPTAPNVAVSPSTITTLGMQTLTVTVTSPGSGAAIEGALVGIQQGDLTTARLQTDAQGHATFAGILIESASETVKVSVMKPCMEPKTVVVPKQMSAPFVAYQSHSVDDSVSGGDADGVVEVGETGRIDVTLKNIGNAATTAGFAVLRPTPQVTMELKVNGTYRPSDILLGKEKAHPDAPADTFTVPLTTSGIRVEGVPLVVGTPTHETFRVWRDEGTGVYTIGALSHSHSADTVFTGIIKCQANFASVSKDGEANDTYFWSGDSIWFQFHADLTEDKITFTAEAPNWFTINSPPAAIPALQPGATTTASFTTVLSGEMPDRVNAVFTVSAYQSLMATKFFCTDFPIPIVRPVVSLASVEKEFGDFGCQDTTWRWTPIIRNTGGGGADTVRLTLHKTTGTMTVLDSTVTLTQVAPGAFASGDGFILCGQAPGDTAGFRFILCGEYEHHKNAQYLIACGGGGGGGGGPNPPTGLAADLINGTVVLRWDPAPGAVAYSIDHADSLTGARKPIDVIGTAATRYEVVMPLQPPGADGYKSYYFFVRTCFGPTICGRRAMVGPIYPWVHEREGWPKVLKENSICAPSVVDLSPSFSGEGYAIVAGTNKLYAWRPDGAPLDSTHADGLFYNPYASDPPNYLGRFTEALAVGDWNTDSEGPEIVGNFRSKGWFQLPISRWPNGSCCRAGTELMNGTAYSNLAPMIVADIQPPRQSSRTVIIQNVNDKYIYAYDANTYTIGNNQRFARYPYKEGFNYRSLAIGYRTAPEDSMQSEVISTTRKGFVDCFATDRLNDFARVRWSRWFGSSSADSVWLSTPAVGDVTGDGRSNEVVVTTLWRAAAGGSCNNQTQNLVPGTVYVLNENTGGATNASSTSCDYHFRTDDKDFPPCGPALAQLDDSPGLEILVAGNTSKRVDESIDPVGITLHIFKWNGTGTLGHWAATDSIPFQQRNEQSQNVFSGLGPTYGLGVQYAIGTPIVAEVDPQADGHYRPDVFVCTSSGAIFAFEYDENATPRLYPKRGWPLLLPDVPREPVLVQLTQGQYSLVVQCHDGMVHVFDLPKTTTNSLSAAWPSYGGDNGNTRGRLTYIGLEGPNLPDLSDQRSLTRIKTIQPLPTSGKQDIVVEASGPDRISLEIYDVSGRLVRSIFQGGVLQGQTSLQWDGKLRDGRRAPSGMYWYRLRTKAGAESRRIVVLR